jgi:hypothetical protein
MKIVLFINHDSESTKLFLKEELFLISNKSINILDYLIEVNRFVLNGVRYIKFYCRHPFLNSNIPNELSNLIKNIEYYNQYATEIDKIEFHCIEEYKLNAFLEKCIKIDKINNDIINSNEFNEFYTSSNCKKPKIDIREYLTHVNVDLLNAGDILTKYSLFDYCVSFQSDQVEKVN